MHKNAKYAQVNDQYNVEIEQTWDLVKFAIYLQ